jgi:hypothetical protein
MRSKTTADLIHRLGLEFGLVDVQMKDLIESQFKFFRNIVSEATRPELDYKNYRFPNLGMFFVSQKRRDWGKTHFNKEEDGSN